MLAAGGACFTMQYIKNNEDKIRDALTTIGETFTSVKEYFGWGRQSGRGQVVTASQSEEFYELLTPQTSTVVVDHDQQMLTSTDRTLVTHRGCCLSCWQAASLCVCKKQSIWAIGDMLQWHPNNSPLIMQAHYKRLMHAWANNYGALGAVKFFDLMRKELKDAEKVRIVNERHAKSGDGYTTKQFSWTWALITRDYDQIPRVFNKKDPIQKAIRLLRKHKEFVMKLKLETYGLTMPGYDNMSNADKLALTQRIVREGRDVIPPDEFVKMMPALQIILSHNSRAQCAMPFELETRGI